MNIKNYFNIKELVCKHVYNKLEKWRGRFLTHGCLKQCVSYEKSLASYNCQYLAFGRKSDTKRTAL